MTRMTRLVLALVMSLTAASGAVGTRYVREIETWQQERARRLTADGVIGRAPAESGS